MTDGAPVLFFVAAVVASSVFGCQVERKTDGPEERLAAFLGDATVKEIDLDSVAGDTLYAVESFGSDDGDGRFFIGRSPSIERFGDSLYIADTVLDALLVADSSYTIVRALGRIGDAPGEFRDPVEIRVSGDQMFVREDGGRIQVFDRQLRATVVSATTSPMGNMGVSDSALYVGLRGEQNLISVLSIDEPFDQMDAFMPPLVQRGRQPGAMNATLSAAGFDDSSVIVAYGALPMLIRLGADLEPRAVGRLTGNAVSEFKHTPLVETSDPGPVGVQMFFYKMNAFGNTLVFTHGRTAYFIFVGPTDMELIAKLVLVSDPTVPALVPDDLTFDRGRILALASYRPAVYVFDMPNYLREYIRRDLR